MTKILTINNTNNIVTAFHFYIGKYCTLKKKIWMCGMTILLSVMSVEVRAIDFTPPSDLPTIEALIALHKEMKKNEDSALTQVATITAEQEVTTNISSKISDIKQTLNMRMNDVNSYLVLASTLTNTTLRLSDLIEEYSNFITECSPIVAKKPYVAASYTTAQKLMADETSRLTKSIAAYTATGVNLLKATMDEKFKLISLIDSSVSRMRSALSRSRNYIVYTSQTGLTTFTVRDIVTSDIMEQTANSLIDIWNRKKR